MEELWGLLLASGVPSTVLGFVIWYLKRMLTQHQKQQEEQEKNIEGLILLILQSERANTILCKATAEAVRDGHCNGNMSNALEIVEKAEAAEKEFLLDKSIKYIFE